MSTRAQFLTAYRAKLEATYDWATNAVKLDCFMASVEQTISTPVTTWVWDGVLARQTWKDIGCTGKMTLKGLRALPAGEAS